jgi:hypothetical protein
MIRVKTPHIRHKRLKGCLTTLSRFCCLSPAIGPKDPRPLASRTPPISPGRDETLQRHEVDKRDSDNRASSWAMSMVYKTLSIRHRLDTARSSSAIDVPRCLSSKLKAGNTSSIQDIFSTIAIFIQINSSRMSSSQVIRFHKYIVTPQVFYKTTSSYGIVNMRPLIRE